MLIFVTIYHDVCIENLLLRLILFTFRIKLKAPLHQMSDFTLSPPILAAILCNAPPSRFSAPPPDNYCTVPKCYKMYKNSMFHAQLIICTYIERIVANIY